MAEHRIEINHALDGPGFIVEVLPPPGGIGHDRELATHREAYGYAAGLRMVMGWPLVDLTEERS
jgi:hypothetical protein